MKHELYRNGPLLPGASSPFCAHSETRVVRSASFSSLLHAAHPQVMSRKCSFFALDTSPTRVSSLYLLSELLSAVPTDLSSSPQSPTPFHSEHSSPTVQYEGGSVSRRDDQKPNEHGTASRQEPAILRTSPSLRGTSDGSPTVSPTTARLQQSAARRLLPISLSI